MSTRVVQMVAVAAAATCLSGLTAGCGSSSNTGTKGSSSSGSGGGGTVTIGSILSLTGLDDTLGPPMKDSLTMGVEAVNKDGGVVVGGKHYTMKANVLDDQSESATVGITDFRRLVDDDNVPVLEIGLGSQNYAAAMKRSELPVISALDSTYPNITNYDQHLFLLRSETPSYAPGCVYYMKNELKLTKLAVIGAGADPYSTGLIDWVKKAAPAYGVTITSNQTWPSGTTNFAPFIQKAMASHPQAFYLGGVTGEQLPLMKQIREDGINLPVFHSSGLTPNQASSTIGSGYNKAMVGNYDCADALPTKTFATSPATLAFANAFIKRWHIYPSDLTMWSYDLPFVVRAAMERAGTVSNRNAIYSALQQIPVPKGTISGWIAHDGKLFNNRDAVTQSQISGWCPKQKTLALYFSFQMSGLKVKDAHPVPDACSKL